MPNGVHILQSRVLAAAPASWGAGGAPLAWSLCQAPWSPQATHCWHPPTPAWRIPQMYYLLRSYRHPVLQRTLLPKLCVARIRGLQEGGAKWPE